MANKPPTPTRRYSASSCHELGLGWSIEAPASLTAAEVERLHDALVHQSDQPHQDDLAGLLADEDLCKEYGLANIGALSKVRFTVNLVHGVRWPQDFSALRKGGAA